MPKLGIHLQHGFNDDEVVVTINGEERLRRQGVRTKRMLGVAEHTKVDVDEGPLSIDVSVPSRNLEQHVDLHCAADLFLGLSITADGTIRAITRDKQFGYG